MTSSIHIFDLKLENILCLLQAKEKQNILKTKKIKPNKPSHFYTWEMTYSEKLVSMF